MALYSAGFLQNISLDSWWADYLATGVILGFVAKEAVESHRELLGERQGGLKH